MSNRPTVIIFSTFYDPWMSGAERCVKEVVERLRGDYHFVLFTARLSRSVPRYEKRDGYEIRRVGIGTPFDKWLYTILAPIVAFRTKAGVAHAIMESYAGIALWVFGMLRPKVKRIITLQSGDLDSEKKQQRIPLWLWKRIHNTPHVVTAISTFLAERAKRLGAEPDRIRVIPNGVDLERIRPRDSQKMIRHRIVTIARLSWEKGLDHLLRAVAIVKEEIPDAHLVLIGDGVLRSDLEKQASELGISGAVEFRGALPNDEALDLLGTGEVFVCPSLAEGLGIVFIEAQAVGVPVIGTRVGGIPDVIKNGETGLLVSPENSEELADALIRILKDQDFGERLAHRARNRLGGFSWKRVMTDFTAQYDGLLQPTIVFAASVYPPHAIGGPASFTAQLASTFAKRLIPTTVVTIASKKSEFVDGGIQIFYCTNNFSYFSRIVREARKGSIVFLQDASAKGMLALIAAFITRTPIIARLGGDLLWERDAASGRTLMGIVEYYTTRTWLSSPLIYRSMLRVLLRFAQKIVFPSALLKNIYEEAGLLEPDKGVVVFNAALDVDIQPVNSTKRQIVMASRFVPLKNILPTLEAMKAAREDSEPFRVLLFGDGPLRNQIVNWKTLHNIDWLEIRTVIPRTALLEEVRHSLALVLLSWSEVSPNVALEALSVGTPVILASENGLHDLLDPFVVHVNSRDTTHVIRSLREIVSQKGSHDARERASTFHWPQSVETMADQYQKIIKRICES